MLRRRQDSRRLGSANGRIIRRRCWKSTGRTCRAGETSGHLPGRIFMKKQVCGQLTLFQEGSLASRFPKPGNEEARRMTVSSGLKCSELFTKSGRLGCLVRMLLASSIWHSTRCLLIWKVKATKQRRSIFQLAVSMPHTEDSESQFWPTPSVGAALCGGTGNFKTLKKMAERGLITEEERRQLSQGNGGKTNPELLEWLMGYERKFTELIPTPVASDANMAASNRFYTHTHTHKARYRGNLCELAELTPLGRIGLLNPEWTEWLMGYEIGWTESNV